MKTSVKYETAKYRVWRFIASSAKPTSRADIAAGVELPEETVQGLLWCLEYRDDAIGSVPVRERANPEEPCWIAFTDVELDPSEPNDEAATAAEESETAGRTSLPEWQPCELARIYGLVPPPGTVAKRPGKTPRATSRH